jgi:hypothetical protein
MPLAAQETYQDTKFVDNDLKGTARYVGMVEPWRLWGPTSRPFDQSCWHRSLSFKSGDLSGGLVSQSGETTSPSFAGIDARINGNKTNASFDQIGLVYSMRSGRNSYMNFGFNYHKSRNFDQILTQPATSAMLSPNKLTAVKYPYGNDYNWNG